MTTCANQDQVAIQQIPEEAAGVITLICHARFIYDTPVYQSIRNMVEQGQKLAIARPTPFDFNREIFKLFNPSFIYVLNIYIHIQKK
jgi:hypothetical protein